MKLFLIVIYLYYIYLVNTQSSTGSLTILTRPKLLGDPTQSSTPFIFLFNKARRKFGNSLDLDIPEIQGKKTNTNEEETTDEIPHVIVKIKTSEKSKTSQEEPPINMTKYIVDDEGKHEKKYTAGQISSRQAPKKPALRVLNLTNSMFDYNAQKIYHTVNGIRLRLGKEHDQRIILQIVQKQVEDGLKELIAIKEKCDKDFVILSNQKKQAMEKLVGLREVMKEKKELDETLSELLDNAVALNIESLGP